MPDYIRWLRGLAGPALLPLAYATAIVRDSAGRVLFQRRSDFGAAWWGLPGGLLEPGETAATCARREVLEETGLIVEPRRLTGVYSSLRYRVHYPNGDEAQQVTACYECAARGGALRPEAEEIEELRFFAPEALPPQPRWYADMLAHALAGGARPYFDAPERAEVETPFPSLMALRGVVGHAPVVWPGAAAAVLDAAGRLLLQRRSDNGQWGLPGGSLDAGESLAYTAKRETLEETGVAVEALRLLEVVSGHEVVFGNGDRLFPVVALLACRPLGGQPRADGRETTEVGYFEREHLPPLPPRHERMARLAFETAEAQ